MKMPGQRVNRTEMSFLSLFAVSLTVVMLAVLFQKSELLFQTQVLDKSMLGLMKYQAGNSRSLFWFVLKERWWIVPLLFLMSTTYLAAAVSYGMVIWYGAGTGAILAIAMLRYGIRGIFLILGAVFPQYLLYVPVMVVTLKLSRRQRTPCKRFFLQLILLEVVVIMGCVLESYVNLMVVEKIIKIFFT